MKRTQLYLNDEMARTLSALSRERGTSVSELIRECIREQLAEHMIDKAALAAGSGRLEAERRFGLLRAVGSTESGEGQRSVRLSTWR